MGWERNPGGDVNRRKNEMDRRKEEELVNSLLI
jgi:hypothetical protein